MRYCKTCLQFIRNSKQYFFTIMITDNYRQNVIDIKIKIMSVQYNNYLENDIWLASWTQVQRNVCLPEYHVKKRTLYLIIFFSFPYFMFIKFIFFLMQVALNNERKPREKFRVHVKINRTLLADSFHYQNQSRRWFFSDKMEIIEQNS